MNNFYMQFLIVTLCLVLTSCEKQVSVTDPDSPIPGNAIVVETEPAGAAIFLNGDNTGKFSPDSILHLESGDYIVTLKRDLFLDTTAAVNLQDMSTERIFINYYNDERNFGNIECTSIPENAEIFLDDSSTGLYTPAVLNFIWPGNHEVKYVYPEHRADSITVKLHASTVHPVEISLQDTSVVVDYHSRNSNFPTDITFCVAVDKEQKKWVGTFGHGLVEYDDNSWTIYNIDNSMLPTNSINCVEVDDFNTKWIGTKNGLVKIDADNNWTVYNTSNSGLMNNYVNAIEFDNNGNTWIASSSPIGMKALAKVNNGIFTVFEVNETINAITIDHQNRVWLGFDKGVRILDGEIWRNDITDTLIINEKTIPSLDCDTEGRIYIAAQGHFPLEVPAGLYIYENEKLHYKPTNNNLISNIYAAENGNVWVCKYGNYISLYSDPDICVLFKINPDDLVTEFTQNNSDIPGFYLMQSVAQPNGDLWIASRRSGIIKFKGANL